jgi:multiple sugar transport system permease protein
VSTLAANRPPRIAVALVAIAAIVMLTPMLWVLILSFKDNAALMADTSSAFLPPWTLANFRSIVGEGQVFTWLMNSVIVSLAMVWKFT